MYVWCMCKDDCEELTKELIDYKLCNNGPTPVQPKYDLTICKKTNAYHAMLMLIADGQARATYDNNYCIIKYNENVCISII